MYVYDINNFTVYFYTKSKEAIIHKWEGKCSLTFSDQIAYMYLQTFPRCVH